METTNSEEKTSLHLAYEKRKPDIAEFLIKQGANTKVRDFTGQDVGIREVDDKIWQVSFMEYDLGFFDEQTGKVEPGDNPFAEKVLPMCPV